MTLTVRNERVYALTVASPTLTTRMVAAYALVKPVIPLPTGITAREAIKRMALTLTNEPFTTDMFEVGVPVAEREPTHDHNTRVRLTPTADSGFGGSKVFYYRRKTVADGFAPYLNASTFDVSGYEDVHSLLGALQEATGLSLLPIDFVNTPITGSTVTLTAATGSHFFIPGTELVLGQ